MSAVIIPVAAASAVDWAAGKLNDADLLLRAPLTPEAIFIVSLPDLRSYRQVLRSCTALWQQGCRCLITRTGNLTVHRHLLAAGCIVTAEEGTDIREQKFRFIAQPEQLQKWLGKFAGAAAV